MRKKLKKIVAACLAAVFSFSTCVFAEFATSDYLIYVTKNGTSKQTNIINVDLPEFSSDEFVLRAVELAVFEKETGFTYSMYKDKDGNESKKLLFDEPQSLHFTIDLGDVTDYRKGAMYKLAYRYYVWPKDDESQFVIVDQEAKDGWKLIGEISAGSATSTGLAFYADKDSGGSGTHGEPTPTPDPDTPSDATPKPTSPPGVATPKPTSQPTSELSIDTIEPASSTGGYSSVNKTIEHWEDARNLYAIKSTAASTKWTIRFDNILNNTEVTIKVVNAEDESVNRSFTKNFSGSTVDITTLYSDVTNAALPDGMYKVLVSAKTTNGTKTVTMSETHTLDVALKRSTPPEPIISQDRSTGEITIEYPDDTNADLTVFPDVLLDEYTKTYKFTPWGEPPSAEEEYTDGFYVDKDGKINAYYTDFAGNQSSSDKNVDKGSGSGTGNPTDTGNNVHTEENRQATVYYINTRRKGDTGLKGEIFEFLK